MDHPDRVRPLHEIETIWSDILVAHLSEGETPHHQARLVLRYVGAVQRYLTRVLRDGDAPRSWPRSSPSGSCAATSTGADPVAAGSTTSSGPPP